MWLHWAQRLQAIAQNGLTYALNDFDRERFTQVQEIAVEIIARHATDAPDQVIRLYAEQFGYATPKVDVRAAVFRDNRILLVQEREDGGWTLPGGWADVGQSASESVAREVHEESGYEVRATKLLAFYERDRHPHPPILFHSFKVIFQCELTGGSPKTSVETTGVDFFAEDDLPPLSLPRILPEQIKHLFDHYRHPEWPTTFD